MKSCLENLAEYEKNQPRNFLAIRIFLTKPQNSILLVFVSWEKNKDLKKKCKLPISGLKKLLNEGIIDVNFFFA